MEKIDLNKGWLFRRIGEDFECRVDIPHDAMLGEKRTASSPGGVNTGWFEGHDYQYRRTISIDKADIGKAPPFVHLFQFVLKLRIIQHSLIIKLAHRLHGLMHAVVADTDIIRKLKHFSRFALRPPTDKAYIFVLTVVAFSSP